MSAFQDAPKSLIVHFLFGQSLLCTTITVHDTTIVVHDIVVPDKSILNMVVYMV